MEVFTGKDTIKSLDVRASLVIDREVKAKLEEIAKLEGRSFHHSLNKVLKDFKDFRK